MYAIRSYYALVKMLEKYFGHVPEKLRQNSRVQFEGYIPQQRILKKDTFQSHCVIGNTAFDVMHPLRISMVLLNNILGGQALNSRLNLALRERRGMAYNVERNNFV